MEIRPSNTSGAINIEYTSSGGKLAKANETDSGYDLSSGASTEIVLPPGEIKIIDTGIHLALPKNIEAQVRPRSGLAAKFGITVLNSPGTIDNGYRGEIKVILINHGKSDYTIKPGERIAQLVFSMVLDTHLIKIKELPKEGTSRGDKGFGSSGRKKFQPKP